jgi:hypothetical protein
VGDVSIVVAVVGLPGLEGRCVERAGRESLREEERDRLEQTQMGVVGGVRSMRDEARKTMKRRRKRWGWGQEGGVRGREGMRQESVS